VLLLDEPTEGIQPSIIKDIARTLNEIRKLRDLTIVVSEQVLSFALDVADRFLVIEGPLRHRRDPGPGRRSTISRTCQSAAAAVSTGRSAFAFIPNALHQPPSRSQSMTETLIKVDLNQPVTENEQVHNRWHPDIPMACWVKPGDDFILETYDWTGGAIKNNDMPATCATSTCPPCTYLSGPVGVQGPSPATCWWWTCSTSAPRPTQWGFNGFFSRQNGGGFLTDHFPSAQKSIWDFKGMFTSSRHIPG
jgi:hypothetical protein